MRTLWGWASSPRDRTIGDVWGITECTCRWWRFVHAAACPAIAPTAQPVALEPKVEVTLPGGRTYESAVSLVDFEPARKLGRLDVEEPDTLDILDGDGEVVETVTVNPTRARVYVGHDWPTTFVPIIRDCAACHKRPAVPDDDEGLCDYCDQFTHVRKGNQIVASYDDYGHRVDLT